MKLRKQLHYTINRPASPKYQDQGALHPPFWSAETAFFICNFEKKFAIQKDHLLFFDRANEITSLWSTTCTFRSTLLTVVFMIKTTEFLPISFVPLEHFGKTLTCLQRALENNDQLLSLAIQNNEILAKRESKLPCGVMTNDMEIVLKKETLHASGGTVLEI